MYFSKCSKCGSNLDPGERCDCQKTSASDERSEEKSEPTK